MLALIAIVLLALLAAGWFFLPVLTAAQEGGKALELMRTELHDRIFGFAIVLAFVLGAVGGGAILGWMWGIVLGLVLPMAVIGARHAAIFSKKDWRQ